MSKIKILNHKEEIKGFSKVMYDYDEFAYPIDLFTNDTYDKWHENFGKFIYDIYGENIPKQFERLRECISKEIHSDGKCITTKGANYLANLSICYMANHMPISSLLKEVFGSPLYHNKFGEGFSERENEPTKKNHASYFIEICGVKVHIGYDRRGTQILIGKYDSKPVSAEKAFYLMVELVKALHKGEKIENENTDKG
jgi:hypothetical protein